MKRKAKFRKKRIYPIGFFLAAVVLLMVLVVVFVRQADMKEIIAEQQEKRTELEAQIQGEEERKEDLDVLEKRVKTNEYVEEVAKDKLGLVHEDEIVIKLE